MPSGCHTGVFLNVQSSGFKSCLEAFHSFSGVKKLIDQLILVYRPLGPFLSFFVNPEDAA